VAGDYKAFSCVDCHEHNNAGDVADEHRDVAGYQYSSNACYSCHPKGGE
jgi:formate-dependent nitrite reductase cytochrome c552 subunit